MYLNKSFTHYLEKNNEVGFVETLQYPLVGISGLPHIFVGEVVIFEGNELGLVFSLEGDLARVLLLDDGDPIVGARLARTGEALRVEASESLLGGSYSSLGKSLMGDFSHTEDSVLMPVFGEAPDFSARSSVKDPLETGVSAVDLMVPLGKGQRELVIGDRKSGKTEFLLQAALSQVRRGAICVYASIGKNKSDILSVLSFARESDILDNFVSVAASSAGSSGEIYLAPYTAMAYAEYFRNSGRDVLLVLDDLSTHAKFYRELSLIAGSFPGRSSYPGDIFSIHSQLLERAGNFKNIVDGVEGSKATAITCLPVSDTVEGDISGYIQTNLMSMTDGHVFFDKALFDSGHRPAVNTFLSVTRVGRQVQSTLHKSLNRELSGFLNLLKKHERFVHFGAELSEGIKTSLETGEKIRAFFNQPPRFVYPQNVQYLIFTLIWAGLLDSSQISSLRFLSKSIVDSYNSDSDFRKYIDDLFDPDMHFNDLLAKVMKEQKEIKQVLGMKV